MAKSVQAGAATAATMLAGGMLGGLLGSKSGGGSIPALPANPAILGLSGGASSGARDQATAAIAAALSASVATYISLKGEANDRRALALAIEQDAAGQLPLGRTIASQARALADCRARQAADYRQRLAVAGEADRRKMKREGDQIAGAIRTDVNLTDRVVGRQADLAKTFTQARAMADGRSEADVLGAQAPAYAVTASTMPLQLAPTTAAAPPPPEVVLVVQRAAAVREAPQAKGKLIMTLPARREVKAHGQAAANGWWEIDVAGAPGYVNEANLSVKNGPALARPVEAQPDSLREYNKVVLEARDEGPNRMKTLLTSFQ